MVVDTQKLIGDKSLFLLQYITKISSLSSLQISQHLINNPKDQILARYLYFQL